nr:unnamed protein product [Callosobruchus analis]
MLGSPDNGNTLGIIPCAISWLFKGINEQKQKTGARFSVRVSAVEICGPTNQLRDLLSGYSNDCEQSPGAYLRTGSGSGSGDDTLFGGPAHCELRVPTAEKAAHYLDAAVEGRRPVASSGPHHDYGDSHLLFTLHVYQYSVAGKGGVCGGRSRLHLLDLGNSDRGRNSGGIPLSGVGNVLLAIFNGQKHLPYKEHKLTQLLRECLGSLTCHAAMIVHVSPMARNYMDTLTTVQLASRIHRMRRRRIKFVSAAVGNGSGGSSGEEAARPGAAGTSSEPDPSSSDLSADTVIYVGPAADDATDGEHPPVYIPSLNSGDNRCSMSKALRGSIAEHRPSTTQTTPKSTQKALGTSADDKAPPTSTHRTPTKVAQGNSGGGSVKTSPAHAASPKSSPSRIPCATKGKAEKQHGTPTSGVNGGSDEQWIDGPRISKSKVAEARHLMKEACHVKKCETWIDGPMQGDCSAGYGYMDSHKKNMIRKWVEHQAIQLQKSKYTYPKDNKSAKDAPKELTQFKSSEEDEVVKPISLRKQDVVEESVIRTGLKTPSMPSDTIPECHTPDERDDKPTKGMEADDDEDEPEMPPALPLIQPLSSREVSLESLDILLKERMLSNAEYNSYHNAGSYDEHHHVECSEDGDDILEIIEVEEPLEPVPTQDCCLQVTEEDIALCMGYTENPLPEVDQENPLDHPLRILSQENLTVVSTFTDSMSVFTDLERILPRHRFERYHMHNDDYEDPDNPYPQNGNVDDITRKKFDQLARLHELYTNRLAKANVANSETYQRQQRSNGQREAHQQHRRTLTRCESLTLTDMLYGGGGGGGGGLPEHDNSSICSEPAYVQQKFCENCKVNMMARPATVQNWYTDPFLSASTQDLTDHPAEYGSAHSGRFQRYTAHHSKYSGEALAYLRHPDGASNPNLREETARRLSASIGGSGGEKKTSAGAGPTLVGAVTTEMVTSQPGAERANRAGLSLETSVVTAVKAGHKSEGYDSGHDSTPRTSKHSPAAMSRRAESGYDSVVRDSESSSVDSEPTRRLHQQQQQQQRTRGRSSCKHRHDKSFCSWFLNPFTCKYVEEPPETHF